MSNLYATHTHLWCVGFTVTPTFWVTAIYFRVKCACSLNTFNTEETVETSLLPKITTCSHHSYCIEVLTCEAAGYAFGYFRPDNGAQSAR